MIQASDQKWSVAVPRGALEDAAHQFGRDRRPVGEPRERETLRLGLELGLVSVLRHVRHERRTQQARVLVLPGLARKAQRSGARATP